MSALPTRIEKETGRPLRPEEIFQITAARETTLSRLLMLYITTGLVFLLLPGSFLGVWNLFAISSQRAANSVSPAWIQAHGHAQIFGWIGTFILGIGFHSIPKMRRLSSFRLSVVWVAWALWTSGVTLHWLSSVYSWHWRLLLPFAALLELVAVALFLRAVSGHRTARSDDGSAEKWVLAVIAGTMGLLLALLMNAGVSLYLALYGASPELPPLFNQRFLVLQTWGFLVPFAWGFSAKWLPIFLGLEPVRGWVLIAAVALNSAGVVAALAGWMPIAAWLLLCGTAAVICALRLFEAPERPANVKGVHASFPTFVRIAYLWALIASGLGIWAASVEHSQGIWGASRHALTVGFLAMMVLAIGERVLPAFSGMRLLFSTKLMLLAMSLLAIGCLLRVSSEILAYQHVVLPAWSWLPVSAVIEMTSVTIFAMNLFLTFASRPPSAQHGASLPRPSRELISR
jgi:hypothetical protein